jgi:hypothetical protein
MGGFCGLAGKIIRIFSAPPHKTLAKKTAAWQNQHCSGVRKTRQDKRASVSGIKQILRP